MTSPRNYDVIIAGGGLVGTSLALGLARENMRVALVEAVPSQSDRQPSFDDRGLALSLSSRRILDGLGVWQAVNTAACPVRKIHVTDQNHFGCVRLNAAQVNLPALGYVVLARELGNALTGQVTACKNIDLFCPATVEDVVVDDKFVTARIREVDTAKTLVGRLLVAADGTRSGIREKLGIKIRTRDYGQTAIVTNVTASSDHQHIAFERFTPSGPLALLPMPENRYAVVFTVHNQEAKTFLDMREAEFLQHIYQRSGRRSGRLQRMGKRKSYSLQALLAEEQVRPRVVILGNAAHTIHPNGAQGFNLCLRDVAGLLDVLQPVFRKGEDIGRLRLLQDYLSHRRPDQRQVECFADGIASVFYNELPHNVMLRNSAMLLLDLCPPLKKAFMQRAMGVSGRQPYLVRHNAI